MVEAVGKDRWEFQARAQAVRLFTLYAWRSCKWIREWITKKNLWPGMARIMVYH